MDTISNDSFLTNRKWLEAALKDEDVIVCYASALECLQLFLGYGYEEKIHVYAKEKGKYDNVIYHIVSDYENLDTVQIGNLVCTSFSQTVNDMLRDFHNMDEQSLLEALNNYYFKHGESFKELNIKQIKKIFNQVKDWAIEYHEEG